MIEKVEKIKKIRRKKIELARENFWDFCNALLPNLYKPNYDYLVDYCDILQKSYQKKLKNEKNEKVKIVMVSMPPQHLKTLTISLFSAWVFGNNCMASVIGISYSRDVSFKMSDTIRNFIKSNNKFKISSFQFSDIFPGVYIPRGRDIVSQWTVTKQNEKMREFSFRAAYLNGALTSFGADGLLIIDDPVPDADVALNPKKLNDIYKTFTDTILSRAVRDSIIVIVQTRWSDLDLIGRVLENENIKGKKYIEYKAYNEVTDKMLCDDFLDKETYMERSKVMSDYIFYANYQQKVIKNKGKLYPDIDKNIYKNLPNKNGNIIYDRILCYVDPSGVVGGDYLAAVFALIYNGIVYILDIYYKNNDLNYIDNLANEIIKYRVTDLIVETNSNKSFYDSLLEKIDNKNYMIANKYPMHQTRNKNARIIEFQKKVLINTFFPADFKTKKEKVFFEILHASSNLKNNKNDDIIDALTGVQEFINGASKNKRIYLS